jgi:PAS domain S-box-containing protein
MDEDELRSEHPLAPASEELLRLVVESVSDYAIFSMDSEGLVTSWNSGAERLLGYRADQIMGRCADIIFTPEDRAAGAFDEERRQALTRGRAEDERWQIRRDGSRFWASGLMMPLADRGRGFVKILRDRTDRHLTGRRLARMEERFRLLATGIPQLVFRARTDGSRTWVSPQWVEFTGLDQEASLESGWLEAVHPDDRAATRAAWHGAEAAGTHRVEHRIRRAADGEYRWHQTQARPIRGIDGGPAEEWVGTMTDIHELRGMQDRQHVLMAELQHRTRNLLAVTQAIAGQTLRNSTSLESFQTQFESRLRALSRVQTLILGVDYTDVDLGELVTAELNAHDAGSLGAGKVRVEGPSVRLGTAAAQAVGLCLHELTTNAMKYGALSQAAGRLEVVWHIEHDDGDRLVVLDWRESSVVMPPGEARRGYGRQLIERALPYQLGAHTRLDFLSDGVHCTIAVTIKPEEEQSERPPPSTRLE